MKSISLIKKSNGPRNKLISNMNLLHKFLEKNDFNFIYSGTL